MSIKQLFSDIAKEMESKCISDTFLINGHNYEMRLLNGEEAQWRNAHIMLEGMSIKADGKLGLTSTNLAALTSIKLPTLAMGIRKIDGVTVEDAYAEDWGLLQEEARISLLRDNKYARKWFVAEHFMEYLANWPDTVLEDLWRNWAELERRRDAAGEAVKKFSGESSEKEVNKNSTELSPSGDTL